MRKRVGSRSRGEERRERRQPHEVEEDFANETVAAVLIDRKA